MIISICASLACVAAVVPLVTFLAKLTLSLWSECMLLRIKIAEQRVRLRLVLYAPKDAIPRR